MANIMGVGEAKKRFSQLMSQVVYDGQRFIIQRRGKPMVALVKAEDIARGWRKLPLQGKGFWLL